METGAARDALLRGVFNGCISSDMGVRHRPYHKNCGCALPIRIFCTRKTIFSKWTHKEHAILEEGHPKEAVTVKKTFYSPHAVMKQTDKTIKSYDLACFLVTFVMVTAKCCKSILVIIIDYLQLL